MSTPTNGNSDRALAERLVAVTSRLQRRLRLSYHVTRLTPARLSALSVIVNDGPCTGGQIAQAEQVTAPTITRILDGLEESGFITRRPSRQDRRIVEVQATDAGRTAFAEATAAQVARLAEDLGHLDSNERDLLVDALSILERFKKLGRPRA